MSKQSRKRWEETASLKLVAKDSNTSSEFAPVSGAQPSGVARPPTWVDITPAIAAKWLEAEHEDNRDATHLRVEMYARDMTNDAWHPNGESIKFDAEGVLVDGGHRLRAVVLSGCTVRMLVCFGVDIRGIDRGRSRSALNERRMRGESINKMYLSAIKTLRRLETDNWAGLLSDADTYEIEADYPLAAEWLREHGRYHGNATLIGSIAFTYPASGAKAAAFLAAFRSGANLAPGSPVLNFSRQLRTMNTAGSKNMRALSLLTLRAMQNHFLDINGAYIKGTEEAVDFWKKRRVAAGRGK